MDIVKQILEQEQIDLQKFKSIEVEKHLEPKIDLGFLMCADPNDLDGINLRTEKEKYITQLTRDNVQLIVNALWEQPYERVEECIVAKLPPPTFVLPRIRKCPAPKLLTKWEKFAQEKGIKKQKKDKKIFDSELNKWVPVYGFKRAQAEKDKNWVLEVPLNADPMEDQFKRKENLKNEKVAKNDIQRMRNIMKSRKVLVPRTGYLGQEAASANELLSAVSIAKASTASVGKFQNKLSKEKEAHGIGIKELIPGMKRKASHVDVNEKKVNLTLINSILNKKPKIDTGKLSVQKIEAASEGNDQRQSESKKSKKGGKSKSSARKPKAGAGQRNPKKKVGGRKRR